MIKFSKSNNMATSKNAAKAAPKKTATAAKKAPNSFRLPMPGEKVSPVPAEEKNGKPVVFLVREAEGTEKKNRVVIEPVGNFYTTGQWCIADPEAEVNY